MSAGLKLIIQLYADWVQRYAPEINKRIRQRLKMSSASFQVDETYIKVGKTYKYLYRAVDKEGQTIEFMLSAKRDVSVAKRFFKKMMRADHRCCRSPLVSIRMLLSGSLQRFTSGTGCAAGLPTQAGEISQ